MSFNFGLNTGLGFGTGFNSFNAGYQTGSIDYAKLNTYTNSIMDQFNSMAYSPINTYAISGAMPNWFNNIASCFNVSFSNAGSMNLPSFLGGSFSTPVNGNGQTKLVDGYEQKKADEKKAEEKKQAEAKETKAKSEKAQKEANEICEKLFVAMKGAGTDEKAVEAALSQITEDNILEVMETFYSQYSESLDGETLIGAIQGDYSGAAEKRIINALKEKLATRATSMGLDTEAKSFRAKVTAENTGFWGNLGADDEIVDGAFTTLLARMIEKRDQG